MNQITKKTRTNWPESTVLCMLDIFKEKHILSHLDHSKYRNSDIFKTVEKSMVEQGLNYSAEQIRIKWKALKVAYKNVIKHNSRSGVDRITCPYYDELDSLLGHRPGTGVLADGMDSDTLNVDQVDEDQTNTEVTSNLFNEIDDTSENNIEPVNCDKNETSVCLDIGNSDNSVCSQKTTKLLNKTKSVRSAPYARALKGFSTEFMESQKQLQRDFFEQQSKLNNEYFEK
uniref:Myb/SANT-like DNA-binding domain-containing protein n=1 Tax=Schizaphis graminum TaxID=13262 RepID=A0A2S2NVU5_SCHGA